MTRWPLAIRDRLTDRPAWKQVRDALRARAGEREPRGAWEGLLREIEHAPRWRLRAPIVRYGLDRLKVLDVGCNHGVSLAFFGPGSLGLELDPRVVEASQQIELPVHRANIFADEFLSLTRPEEFDAAWCYAVIEHVSDPHSLLMRIRSRLRDGGLLLLGAPTIPMRRWTEWIARSLYRVGYGNPRMELAYTSTDHVNAFTRSTLKFFIERSGFTVEWVGSLLLSSPAANRLLDAAVKLALDDDCLVVARKRAGFEYPAKATRRVTADGWRFREDL